jgi:hypothetical protein
MIKMLNKQRTIIGACDYSLEGLKLLKRELMDVSCPNKEINWAIGGLVFTLVAHLLQTCEKVIAEAMKEGFTDCKSDMIKIKTRFNEIIDNMINHE